MFWLKAVLLVCLAVIGPAYAEPKVPVNVNASGVFLDGYDVVSYFADGKAMRGSDEFQYEWRGMRFYFKTQANLAMFVSEPSRYIPQFNGHCANGLSDGHLVRANPEIFRIIDGKLYLFFSWWGKAQWKFDQQEQIELANKFWLEFSQ